MRNRLFCVLFSLMSFLIFAQSVPPAASSKRVALLVGMQGIKGFNPDKDLINMQGKLKTLGFDVKVIKPESEEDFKNEVADFEKPLKKNPSDMTLFYFTGYGFSRNQQSYLRFDSTYQSGVEFNSIIKHLPATRELLLLLDIGLPQGPEQYTRGFDLGVSGDAPANTTLFIGCSGGELGNTLPTGEGAFTQAMAASLQKGMSIDAFVNAASVQTVRLVKSLKLPWQQPEIHKTMTVPSLFRF